MTTASDPQPPTRREPPGDATLSAVIGECMALAGDVAFETHELKRRPGHRTATFFGRTAADRRGTRVLWGIVVKQGDATRITRLATAWRAIVEALRAAEGDATGAAPAAPAVLAAAPRAGWVAMEAWPGVALAAESDAEGRAHALRKTVQALAWLERRGTRLAWPDRRWTPEDECERLAQATALLGDDELCRAVRDGLVGIPGRPLGPAHRDLNAEQIVIPGGPLAAARWVDWDEACWAPPGLDLGNLLAHERLAALRGVITADVAGELRAGAVESYRTSGGALEAREVAVWEAAACARLAGLAAARLSGRDDVVRNAAWLPVSTPAPGEPDALREATFELLAHAG